MGVALIALIAILAGASGGDSTTADGGPKSEADMAEQYVKTIEKNYDYSWAGRGDDPAALDQFYLRTLEGNGYSTAHDPSPEMAILYAKATCVGARAGGNPVQQLGAEFRNQPNFGAYKALFAASAYCSDDDLILKFGTDALAYDRSPILPPDE